MDEYDVLGGYLPSFVQHLKDTGARLGSRTSEGPSGTVAEADALSSWTPAEHDAFFRAVSVHSRWRPDLIVACVPTKTEWEVWMYLEALEEGVAALAMQQDGEDVGGSGDEHREAGMHVGRSRDESDSDADSDEGVCEPALEVSQAWIDAEERMAAWIVQQEHLACVDVEGDSAAANTEDVEDVPRKRKRGQPHGTRRGCAQSRARTRAVAEEGRHSSPRADRSPSSEPSLTSARKRARELSRREALMGHLELPHLLVLDGILREGEEAMKEKSNSRSGSVTETTPTEYGDEGESHVRSDPHQTSSVSESQSNVVIDPVLLAMSGVDPAAERQSARALTQSRLGTSTPGPSSLHHVPSQLALLEVPLQHGAFAATHTTNPYPTANVDSDLSLFSPRTRRRIHKRLYMRRKRALLSTGSESVIDTGIEKLRPGKKAKSERNETPAVSTTSVACSETASSDAEENVPRKNKAGLTLPYKLKAQFSELGIDAAYLVSEGMHLLNLGALGKLMGLYSSLERGEEEEEESAMVQSIDAQLIRHLQSAMVSFVTDIVHRAIVWRERDTRLKQRSQAWRHSDQITVAAIEHAVDAVGGRYHSHKEYFNALDVPADGEVETIPRLSPHRDVYTPLVRPPLGCALACLTRTYAREATRTRRGPSADLEEDVMSDETDEEALEGELEAEAEAEVVATAVARRAEARLWASVRIKD